MALGMYIGVDGIARKVKKMYVGVDNVAREVKKGYIGVSSVARPFFADFYYRLFKNWDSGDAVFTDYTIEVVDGVLNVSASCEDTNASEGRTIAAVVYGNLAGKEVSFDYVGTGYNIYNSTIEYKESYEDGTTYTKALNGSGSFTRTIPEGVYRFRFSIWFSGTVARTASLVISNATLDGENIF